MANETNQTDRNRILKTIAISIAVGGLCILAYHTGYNKCALDSSKTEIAAFKETLKVKAIDADLPSLPTPVVAPAPTAPVSTPKVEKVAEAPLLGLTEKSTVRLHTLNEKPGVQYDISTEMRETSDAFETCVKKTGIQMTLCVTKTKKQRPKGYNIKYGALAKAPNGMSATDAKKVAACFNQEMDIDGQSNNAEPALLDEFEDDCLTPLSK